MKKFKFFFLISGVLLVQITASITLATSITYGMDHTKAPQGFEVWGKDLSGLTLDEGYKRLEAEIPREVKTSDASYAINISQSQKNLRNWLGEKYAPGSTYWFVDALDYLKRMGTKQISPERLDPKEVLPQLENLAQKINRDGKAASLQMTNGKFVVQPGTPQVHLDIQASWERLRQSTGIEPVPLKVDSENLHPDAEELSKVQARLGDYTTYFNPNIEGRTNNVRLAAKALNGVLLKPGEEFSFNQTVGKRDKETGYLPAYVFINQKVVMDDGGGICQDSSTLFHAVEQAHLEILERNTHSLPVTYVPQGQDATVAYGLLDFRFRNNTQGYLYIDARTGSNWVRIRFYGVADKEHPVLAEADGFPMKPADTEAETK